MEQNEQCNQIKQNNHNIQSNRNEPNTQSNQYNQANQSDRKDYYFEDLLGMQSLGTDGSENPEQRKKILKIGFIFVTIFILCLTGLILMIIAK